MKRRRKRMQIRVNLPDHGAILAMSPCEMLTGPTEHWRGVSIVKQSVDDGHSTTLYRVQVDSQTCWVLVRDGGAVQYDTRVAAIKAYADISPRASGLSSRSS
jgi:hypothetical protein